MREDGAVGREAGVREIDPEGIPNPNAFLATTLSIVKAPAVNPVTVPCKDPIPTVASTHTAPSNF